MKTKYSILFLLLFAFASCQKDNVLNDMDSMGVGNSFSKGVFGLRDASKLTELGAEYTRILVWDTDLEALYSQVDAGTVLENIPEFNQIKSIFESGVKIIMTLRWPDQNSSDPKLYDRVPLDEDRVAALDLLRRFLVDFGPIIEVYSVQNEVGGLGPGTYMEDDMINAGNGSPAVQWWEDIMETIQEEKKNNSALSHLKISSPTPVLLKRLVFDSAGLPQTNIDFFYETIDFGNTHCDFIDFHFNTFTLAEHTASLNFLMPLVSRPMISTEWSEVASANDYIAAAVSDGLKSLANSINYIIPESIETNDALVEHLYNNPAPSELWELMVEESNYQTGFMQESGSLLSAAGFEILCWNSGWQEGLAAYDLRSFYATMTVSSQDNEIQEFTSEFKDLD